MIEVTILDYLNEKLDVPVVMQLPCSEPEFVLIEKTSGRVTNHIKTCQFALQSYAESLYKAAVLNDLVKQAMDDAVLLDNVQRSKLNSDYNFTDTTKKNYRYQAVYDLTYTD